MEALSMLCIEFGIQSDIVVTCEPTRISALRAKLYRAQQAMPFRPSRIGHHQG